MEEEQRLRIEGPAGRSIFHEPKGWLLPADRVSELQRRLDEYWRHYKDLGDERALVVVGALCVENSLDDLVRKLLPGHKELYREYDFGFSLKIRVLAAFRFLPERIIKDCHLVRRVRNDFAHDLGKKNLSDCDEMQCRAIDRSLKEYSPTYQSSLSPRKRFEDFVAFVCVALNAYAIHAEQMRRFLDSGAEFGKALKQFVGGRP